ncbi:MAG: hypothetical protein KAX26_18655, partial [Anaerolineae bacterium]|nr:hypothetical protein [Anaerolineae bacterium]
CPPNEKGVQRVVEKPAGISQNSIGYLDPLPREVVTQPPARHAKRKTAPTVQVGLVGSSLARRLARAGGAGYN